MMGLQIYVIGCSQTTSDTLDGSTRIFIECAKRWAKSQHEIRIFTCEEGYELFRKYGLSSFNHTVISSSRYEKVNIYLLYLIRAIRLSVRFLRTRQSSHKMIIYSGSDFWPDSFPAWVLKIRFPKAKWIAGFYLFSPQPFSEKSPYKGRRRLRGLLYYMAQIPIFHLVKRYSDMVWVTSEIDRMRFICNNRLTPDRVIAVRGGVDAKTPGLLPEPQKKRFEAVFIGRFHPQKGVLELIDIWKYMCERKKDA
ncbi:hypothetical protein MUP37_01480, partial [Candidatus Bathyarchaeota archaeon]|nr:hypothetical protein [Candidatus Bathyarchaeota archaeon]